MSEIDVTGQYADLIKQQALSVAKRFLPLIRERVDVDDLISEGNLAALESYKNYDPERQPDLGKYIGVNVRFQLLRYVASNMYDLNVPFSTQYIAWRDEELGRLANNHAMRIDGASSYTAQADDSDNDQMAIPSGAMPVIDNMEKDEDIKVLKEEFARLKRNEQIVLESRFMGDKRVSREELGMRLNINPVTAAAIEERAISKLKNRVRGRHGYEDIH